MEQTFRLEMFLLRAVRFFYSERNHCIFSLKKSNLCLISGYFTPVWDLLSQTWVSSDIRAFCLRLGPNLETLTGV